MTRRVLLIGFAVVALTTPPPLPAQTASDLLSMGMRAFQNLDYDQAASALRRGLARTEGDTLSEPDRLQALIYLGATELFRGRRDSAVAAFRQLLTLDAGYRPNALIFPPQVTELFQEARHATATVAVEVAPVTELRVGAQRFIARLEASSPDEVTVAIARDGASVRPLYEGAITDSLKVEWDGLTAGGRLPEDGRYQLRVTSGGRAGRAQRVVQVPLEINRVPADTSQPSPAPVGSPGRLVPRPPVRPLAGGALAAVAVIVLPNIIARDADASGARFAVASAIGVSTLVAFLTQRRGPPIAATAGPDQALRNDRRSPSTVSPVRLTIRAGQQTVLEPESP